MTASAALPVYQDNWALIADSGNSWGMQKVVHAWLKVFLDLHTVAVSSMSSRSDFAEFTIRVPARFFARQQKYSCSQLQESYLVLQYRHISALLDWGAEECVPRGESVLCSRSVFRTLAIRDLKKTPITVTATDELDPTRCTLEFEWHQSLVLGEGTLIRLVYSDGTSSQA
jgi:hypothetical protein